MPSGVGIACPEIGMETKTWGLIPKRNPRTMRAAVGAISFSGEHEVVPVACFFVLSQHIDWDLQS